MPLIRDTIDPLNEREVSDEEALDLERYGILLTGTRAKRPETLRSAAIRQVTEQLEGTAVVPAPAIGSRDTSASDDRDPDDDDGLAIVVTSDGVEHVGVLPASAAIAPEDDTQTPGDAPASTTDTRTDSQES